ncbi:MAG: hypothetical protein COA79_21845 [Planctomycetota bacterium]|nr:MAG: hypothetical protein COA79_21845 [Planctomycetota bacterium]
MRIYSVVVVLLLFAGFCVLYSNRHIRSVDYLFDGNVPASVKNIYTSATFRGVHYYEFNINKKELEILFNKLKFNQGKKLDWSKNHNLKNENYEKHPFGDEIQSRLKEFSKFKAYISKAKKGYHQILKYDTINKKVCIVKISLAR